MHSLFIFTILLPLAGEDRVLPLQDDADILLIAPQEQNTPTVTPEKPKVNTQVVPVDGAQFGELTAQLRDPRYNVRETAMARLAQAQDELLPQLVVRYHEETSFEVKRRLRYIIESLFFRKLIAGEEGFLGIRPTPIAGLMDPTTGEVVEAIRVVEVIEGHAAIRAGVQAQDHIIEYDGESVGAIFKQKPPDKPTPPPLANGMPWPMDPRVEAFTHRVKTTEPGKPVALRILRGRPVAKELVGEIDFKPANLLAGLQFVATADGWVMLRGVREDSAAGQFGLQDGDSIRAVNGVTVPPNRGSAPLQQALAAVDEDAKLVLSVQRLSYEEVNLEVVLGRRPLELLNHDDEAVARTNFLDWWRAQGGDVDTREELASLRLTPSFEPGFLPESPESTLLP